MSKPLPGWRKWTYRVVGGFLVVGAALTVPKVILVVQAAIQLWKKPGVPSETVTYGTSYAVGFAGAFLILAGLGTFLLLRSFRRDRSAALGASFEAPPPIPESRLTHGPIVSKRSSRRRAGMRVHTCNVLRSEAHSRELWQFGGGKFTLLKAESKPSGEPLPDKLIAKDWHTLFQPRLNVAWIPADKVFLRVLQLPKADAEETRSMVDLQLEKISPLPVAQIVWSYEVVPMVRQNVIGQQLQPHATGELQTVIVIMVGRHHVEEFLGQIEGQGYLPDRLELPMLDQLLGLRVDADGVWVLPGSGANANTCLVSWWYGGVLQYVNILHLPEGAPRALALQEQIAQTAWAGETEGWITSEPKFKLVADEETAAAWLPLFESEQHAEAVTPAPLEALAQETVRRVAGNGKTTNLLPPEYAARYKQQFIDRLWMRALGAVVVLYLVGVMVYIGIAKVVEFQYSSLQKEVRTLGVAYTNTIRLKEQVTVMQDTLDLQYAALECYKAIADNLPTELTLRSIRFDQGRKVTYSGTAAPDDQTKVLDLNEKMLRVTMRDQPLFVKVNAPDIRPAPGGQSMSWSFACDLKRAEGQ